MWTLTERPLTRAACLADYRDCYSVAVWQQCHAVDAYQRWQAGHEQPAQDVLCLNWGAAHFRAPGPSPVYQTFLDAEPQGLGALSAIFALSVIDRIDQPMRFLRTQADRLVPGGLLVCTFAAWDAAGLDCAVGHELRHRIYNRDTWGRLLYDIRVLGLCAFGGVDLRYRGDTLGDHTLATLVVRKHT